MGPIPELTRLLLCPECRQDLPALAEWPAAGVRCAGCQAVYRIEGGIPRFVQTDGYAGSFSFEWLRHRRTQLDAEAGGESEREFRRKTGLRPEDVRGKLVLDAGCGMGRFADVVSRWGGRVVAVDLSRAVEAAQENLQGRASAVFQADLSRLPFREGGFDLIYSIGVLHHTPHAEGAFRHLVRALAPGGTIAIWVYPDDHGVWMKFSDSYRRYTVRWPSGGLYALCHAAIPFYYLLKIPLLGRLLWTVLPMSVHPNPRWRVLDTFDWYSPRYQSRHTYPEVSRWFQAAGLTAITLLDVPIAVSGVKRPEHEQAA
ncbi:MAG: class I SAM-dependent methyltransferase [Candidatus Omnitrophica bacterium]|nr:class I SAM-dependent methyltransferase [Candidatus Omnitrophota bacterium]